MTIDNNIKISFIIPIYNAEQYLNKCVDSILSQDYKNIEIILVNDGSTDDSKNICDQYTRKFNFIKTIHKENGGVSSTRNVGIKESSGDYIFFIDNDDWIGENKLGALVAIIKKTDVDIVINRYFIVDETKSSVGNQSIDKNFINGKSTEEVLNYFRKKRINIMAPWEYVIRRDIIVNNDICFNPLQNGVDDSVFSPTIFCHCESFYLNEDPIYFWRQRMDSQGRKHIKHDYLLKMVSTIETLRGILDGMDKVYKINYIYFSLYKNIFSLLGQYYNFCYEDKIYLKKYFSDILPLIKKSIKCSGVSHRILSILFGYFLGIVISYNLAKMKSRLYFWYFRIKKNS